MTSCTLLGIEGNQASGVSKRLDETTEAFNVRKEEFTAAKTRCSHFIKEKNAEKEGERERSLMDAATSGFGLAGQRRPGRQPSIREGLDRTKQQQADDDIAKAMYATDIPFHALEHDLWKVAFKSVLAAGPGYVPPGRRALDGATDENRRPILNLLNVSPRLVEFIKAANCEGKVKDKVFIARFITQFIWGLDDPRSVVQVLMDNATRGSWPLIEEECPWVVVGPCETHVGDLELEDQVKKIPFFKEAISHAHLLRKFVKNHSHVLAEFKNAAETMLTQPGPTRFATVHIGLSSLSRNLEAVSKALLSEHVVKYVRDNRNQRATPESPTLGALYQEAKDVSQNILFPLGLQLVLNCMDPVVKLLRFSDSDGPTASKMQYCKFQVQEKLKALTLTEAETPWEEGAHSWPDIQQELVAIHRHRWDYGYTILQGAEYLLDPEYVDMDQHEDIETMEAFRSFVSKTFHPPLPPAHDASAEVKAAFEAECESLKVRCANAEVQLLQYKNKEGVFAREITWTNAKRVSAADFWALYGSEVPDLQVVAMRACAQSCAATASERGHKVMNAIEWKKRNRLSWETVDTLIYVKHNHAQLRKRRRMDGGLAVIPWAEGLEEPETDWVDAWQEEEEANQAP
ncbi:hypothetical protein CYMTET_15209 [Cymbomonas tetramitiformis]|uniref:HAT C-terminal dimerisation domain-containing protein n=1 Tax=Cymbomonas tetramitiformis TaxID=36881 RepID=A0AAE0GF13_9CHLO|nr:hypothetical protein CYMTET_15209 [Cymbomonas tetramitiformis]